MFVVYFFFNENGSSRNVLRLVRRRVKIGMSTWWDHGLRVILLGRVGRAVIQGLNGVV